MAKYLLPCPACGKQISVESGQAGQTVTCQCGNRLEVPTMRGLAALARADEPIQAARGDTWNARKGLALAGFLVSALALGAAGYLYATMPLPIEYQSPREQIIGLPASEALKVWRMIEAHGVDLPPSAHEQHIDTVRRRQTLWLIAAGVVGVIGILMLLAGLLWKPKPIPR